MIGRTIGQYQVIDKIGEGGMGAVYKAEDTTLHRLVALKTLSGHLSEDEEARERFVREAQSASSLNHPNITTVYEFLEDEDTRLICMEYIEGKTIRDMVESGIVSVRKAIDIIMQVAEALDAAHNKGILHRDVKSANIMVNMEGRVKVMDFGLAHLESRSQLTRTGTTMGTLSYSSPEQISGKPVDRRSEIFSLGVVFYELLTGQLPFKATNEAEILFAIINNEPPKLTSVREDVPELVEAVVERMLEKDSELRYQTCSDVISDLKGIRKEMETSTVGITGVRERIEVRSRKRIVIAVSAGITAVVGLIAFYLLLLIPGPSGPPRIAVLPFEEIGPLAEEYFGNAIALEVHGRLVSIAGIEVVEFYSTDQYETTSKSLRQVGDELNVDYLVRGTLQREQTSDGQTHFRLNPRLIQVSDETTLWAPTSPLEATGTEIFKLQSEFAQQIAQSLNVALSERERSALAELPTENQDAYIYYLQGVDYAQLDYELEYARIALQMYQRAVDLDPGFALAHARLARAHLWLWWGFGIEGEEEKAQKSIEEAVKLKPDDPETHWTLGYNHYVNREYDKAIVEYSLALDQRPNDADILMYLAFVQRRRGLSEDTVDNLKRAVDLSPRSFQAAFNLGITYHWIRHFREAIEWFDRAISLAPDVSAAYMSKSYTLLKWKGDISASRQVLVDAPIDLGKKLLTEFSPLDPDFRSIRRIQADYLNDILIARSEYKDSLQYHSNQAEVSTGLMNSELARAHYDSARVLLEATKPAEPRFCNTSDMNYLTLLGIAYAGSGNKPEAIHYGEQAVGLVPVEWDAFMGPDSIIGLAEIYTMTGEPELAIDKLEYALSISSQITVQLLRIDPRWNPLRDYPRFQALLDED